MTIYITGSTGKIGQRLLRFGALPLLLNLTDRASIKRACGQIEKGGTVVHLAAMSSIAECQRDYDKALAVNTWGTSALCDALDLYGIKRLVVISSEQVFNGFWGNYKENAKPGPVNNYGFSKLGAESVAQTYGAKVLRLSRVVSAQDPDIAELLVGVHEVPTFIKRSYSHVDFAARFIWQYANRFDEMPEILHYGGERRVSFRDFIEKINPKVLPRRYEEKGHDPRPFNCGLNVSLARKLGLPIQTLDDCIMDLLDEAKLTI